MKRYSAAFEYYTLEQFIKFNQLSIHSLSPKYLQHFNKLQNLIDNNKILPDTDIYTCIEFDLNGHNVYYISAFIVNNRYYVYPKHIYSNCYKFFLKINNKYNIYLMMEYDHNMLIQVHILQLKNEVYSNCLMNVINPNYLDLELQLYYMEDIKNKVQCLQEFIKPILFLQDLHINN